MQRNMCLSREEFDVLVYMESVQVKGTSQQAIEEKFKYLKLGINKVLTELEYKGFMQRGCITEKGLYALEPYRVKRAVLLAAGLGSRLSPVTLNTPKPLVTVNGVRMIDTLLDAVQEAGIEEIIIVRGYLSERFDELLDKYPNLHFVENPSYDLANNISSIMCVRHLLKNAYILESDLFLYNKELITKYQYNSNYLGISMKETHDWCFETKDGVITKLKVGGKDCYQMVGISYWNEEDGEKLNKHIQQAYGMPGGRDLYWDQVALELFSTQYQIAVRECSFDDVVEVDSYIELQKLDNTYC